MKTGDTIGKYRLVRRLGRGGMGEVWLALAMGHGGFAKNVVLKTLLPELARERLFVDLLVNEARIGAKLSHPNLIEVFDFSEHDGTCLIAMEYVHGYGLHQLLGLAKERGEHLPVGLTLRIALDCCRGLHYAHGQGIIHCDLSPGNVMVTSAGTTKILDFGVAHLSAQGRKSDRLKGKFSYMAPERIESLVTDRRTDVYAIGIMMYLLLTGSLPFAAPSDQELFARIVEGAPLPPSQRAPIDSTLEQVVLRAMAREPSARFQTAADLLAALQPIADACGAFDQQDMTTWLARFVAVRLGTEDETTIPVDLDTDAVSIDIEIDIEHSAQPAVAAPARLATIPARPATVFGLGSRPREPHTSVQSLFESARTIVPIERVASRGGFGAYSDDVSPDTSRADAAAAWPWPTSRMKSH